MELPNTEEIKWYVADFRDFLQEGTFPERKALIRNFVEGIEVVGDEATLTYTVPMPSDGVTSESASVLDFVQSGPLLPTVMTFSRRSTYSQRAICMTRCLFTDGMAGSRRCRALYGREACSPDPALHHAMMVVYQLKLI